MTRQMIQNNDFVVQLFVIVDELIKILNSRILLGKKRVGRNPVFFDSEIIVLIILRWKTACTSWKSFYHEVFPLYYSYFQKHISYQNFIESIHRIMPLCLQIIPILNFFALGTSKMIFYLDSCPIEVCHIKRASHNKVCKGFASRKKSSIGWFFGFKLHVICNHLRQIVAIEVTTASVDDREPVLYSGEKFARNHMGGCGIYQRGIERNARTMRYSSNCSSEKQYAENDVKVEYMLLKRRQKIEQIFSVVKTRFGLDCSLARSVKGVFSMLLSAVLWYQMKALFFGKVNS